MSSWGERERREADILIEDKVVKALKKIKSEKCTVLDEISVEFIKKRRRGDVKMAQKII